MRREADIAYRESDVAYRESDVAYRESDVAYRGSIGSSSRSSGMRLLRSVRRYIFRNRILGHRDNPFTKSAKTCGIA